jgi:hypothetical protein
MNSLRKVALSAAFVGTTLVGGAVGSTLLGTANAATSTTTTPAATATTTAATATPASGTFKSNENFAHEAGESAAREAQEDAGQMPTVP